MLQTRPKNCKNQCAVVASEAAGSFFSLYAHTHKKKESSSRTLSSSELLALLQLVLLLLRENIGYGDNSKPLFTTKNELKSIVFCYVLYLERSLYETWFEPKAIDFSNPYSSLSSKHRGTFVNFSKKIVPPM